ncbi:MAG: hypothetical protein IKJ19_07805 [Clostridia bacterium]|nr:hypothetical protein [Clostridia bacterium]
MNEKQGYLFTIDTSMLDKNGVLTPAGYQRIVITTTEKELKKLNMEISTLISNMGVSWVLLSLTVKVLKQIKPNQELLITTHHTWQKGVIYRRDFLISDALTCEEMAYATTFSSLLDIQKRRICADRTVYQKLALAENEELFEAESRHAVRGEFDFCEEAKVKPSWIDSLGHVNNFKYGELCYDNIPDKYLSKMNKLNRLEMFFTGELRLGDSVKIFKRVSEDYLEICGEHSSEGKSAFFIRMKFDD